MLFNIIENNDDFIIINKPAGLSFHSENNQAGVFAQLENLLEYKIWPVHRLDKVTSGLLIFAKNKSTASLLGNLFESKQVNKTYLAISDKKPKKKQGKIIGDMQASRGGCWKLTQSKTNPAVTHFLSTSLIPDKRVFWLKPKTGKTHQLRVALKSLGSAILGDQRYSGSQADRAYLHAYQLNFVWKEQLVSYSCLPIDGIYFLLTELQAAINYFKTAEGLS